MNVHEKIAVDSSRKVSESWTRGDNYRVKVTTWHDKTRKAYLSNISECQIQPREGYTMEFFSPFSDLNKLIQAEQVSRYNFANLQAFHLAAVAQVLDQVEQLLANPSKVVEVAS
jgi:hypothetical protein